VLLALPSSQLSPGSVWPLPHTAWTGSHSPSTHVSPGLQPPPPVHEQPSVATSQGSPVSVLSVLVPSVAGLSSPLKQASGSASAMSIATRVEPVRGTSVKRMLLAPGAVRGCQHTRDRLRRGSLLEQVLLLPEPKVGRP